MTTLLNRFRLRKAESGVQLGMIRLLAGCLSFVRTIVLAISLTLPELRKARGITGYPS